MRLLIILCLFTSFPFLAAGADERPNILYLYVDDMGWGSIGPNGQAEREAKGKPYVLTPNINALAAAGVNFQRAYGCTVCSPARSSQQLGMHQGHTYADRNHTDNARKAMRTDDLSMGKVLAAAGYNTGYWGKWGYGGTSSLNNPELVNHQTLPNAHGYGHVLAELHHVRAHSFFQPTLWTFTTGEEQMSLSENSLSNYTGTNYPQHPANQSDPNYPTPAYCDDLYAMKTLDFVRSQAQNYNKTNEPFFALFASQIPHAPFDEITELPNWDEAYANQPYFSSLSGQAQQWAAMVTRIDAHIGNLLAALEDPNHDGDSSDSVANNTLVIFMSDNGGPSGKSSPQLSSNGGLRGHKGSLYEGGIRVPCVMRWPDKITSSTPLAAGSNSDFLLDVSDLLATFAELAGAERPLGIDGVSIAPLLTNEGEMRSRPFLIHEAQPRASIMRGDYKLISANGAHKLYNITRDPNESTNIARQNTALASELLALMTDEQVFEKQWHANTYHRWTGLHNEQTSDGDNWSDYEYKNEVNSTIYMEERGAPQASWTARIINESARPQVAVIDADLEVLALEVKGASAVATQTLQLTKQTLAARNEVRLSGYSSLHLDSGTITSQRWLEIGETSSLVGAGDILTNIYNAGLLQVNAASSLRQGDDITAPNTTTTAHRQLSVSGLLSCEETSVIDLTLAGKSDAGKDFAEVVIEGKARLDGELVLTINPAYTPKPGDSHLVITASDISGEFTKVTASDGSLFELSYTSTTVTVTAAQPTSSH